VQSSNEWMKLPRSRFTFQLGLAKYGCIGNVKTCWKTVANKCICVLVSRSSAVKPSAATELQPRLARPTKRFRIVCKECCFR
jgi:hypothetical protein